MNPDVAIVGAGYVGVPLAQVFAEAGKRVVLVDVQQSRVDMLNRGESYIEDVPSELMAKLVANGLSATTDYDVLRDADAILIALPTPLSRQREPDLSIVMGAVAQIVPRLRKGHLVVLESTTYPGTTREEIMPVLESSRAGLRRGLLPGVLAGAGRSGPHGLDDEDGAEGRRRDHAGLHGARRRAVRQRDRHDPPRLHAGGGRADEAAGEHLPLGQHRARQRAGDPVRPDADRHLGGGRGRRDEAVRVHAASAPAPAWAATASRSTRST